MRSPVPWESSWHLALIGVFLSLVLGILDFRQALWVVVAIAGIASTHHRRRHLTT